jgi:hypothetical protein
MCVFRVSDLIPIDYFNSQFSGLCPKSITPLSTMLFYQFLSLSLAAADAFISFVIAAPSPQSCQFTHFELCD